MISRPVVYVVDDDEAAASSLQAVIAANELAVRVFISAEAFLESYTPSFSGCLLVDVRMTGMNGLELLRELNKRNSPLRTIMISGHADRDLIAAALREGAVDFFEKPFSCTDMIRKVRQIIGDVAAEHEATGN